MSVLPAAAADVSRNRRKPSPMRASSSSGSTASAWSIPNPDPTVLLTDYLHGIGLTGTKVGCGQGGCGACTVMLSHRDPHTGAPVHRAINACLRPLCALDGMMVTTTEGIGNVHDGLDPVQHCIAMHNGTQCGFCTPGFVMNAHAFLQKKPAPIAAGDRGHLRRQSLSLHGLSTHSSRRADPGLRLRCRRGPDPEMPDGSFVPGPVREASWPGSTWSNCPRPGQPRALHFTRQRPRVVPPDHARGGPPAQETVRRARPAGSRSSSSSATRPRESISRRSRRYFIDISAHRRAGTDRRGGNGHPRRGHGADPATDRFRHRSDRPAARRADDRAAGVDPAHQLSGRLSGALRRQRRRQHLHDARPRPPRRAVSLRPVHDPGHPRHDDPHRLARLRGRKPGVSLDRDAGRGSAAGRRGHPVLSHSLHPVARVRADVPDRPPAADVASDRQRRVPVPPERARARGSRAKPPSSTAAWLR